MILEAKIHKIDKIQKEGEIKVIKVIVTPNDTKLYPDFLPTEIMGYNSDILEGFEIGDFVILFCELKCREFNEKYFLSVRVYKIIKGI